MEREPSVQELIDAAKQAIRGRGDKNADFVRGSDYESLSGATAMIWNHQALRDSDLFNATRFHTATGDDLTNLVLKRYGIQRDLDTVGTGKATLSRPAAGIADALYKGSRFRVRGPGGVSTVYKASRDRIIASSETTVSVDIEALTVGPGSKINAAIGIALDDAMVDPSWTVTSLQCSDGTVFEPAPDLIARVRQSRLNNRVGFSAAIVAACKNAGAGQVAVFRSDYGGDDLDAGLNVCYVGDSGYVGTPNMVKACTIAVRSARVGGDHMQVLPMARAPVDVVADIYLRSSPANFDTARLESIQRARLIQALSGTEGSYGYTRVSLTAALIKGLPEVQDVVFSTPLTDAGVLVNGNFPAVLNRYFAGNISLRYLAI